MVKGDAFTRDLFRWLDQVRDDATLTGSEFKLAYVIGGYLNRLTGDAWPSLTELAERHGTTPRTVLTCLRALKDRGHLAVESGRGRHRVSHYRPIIRGRNNTKQASLFPSENTKDASPYPDGEKVKSDVKKGEEQRQKTRSRLHTEPSEEPSEEPIDSHTTDLLGDSLSPKPSKKKTEAKRRSAMPITWPDDGLKTEAANYWVAKGRIDLVEDIEDEAERARQHHLKNGNHFVDWAAAWRTWFRKTPDMRRAPHGAKSKSIIEAARRYAERHGMEIDDHG